MMRKHRGWGIGLLVACWAAGTLSLAADEHSPPYEPELLVVLPDAYPTPDALAIPPDGDLVVSCPNFADTSQPPALIKITPELEFQHWVTMPPMEETGRVAPMGIRDGIPTPAERGSD